MEHFLAIGGQYAFGMELDSSDVEFAMAEGHDLSFIAYGGHFETVGQAFARYYPRVVASDGDVARDAAEDRVVGNDMTWGGDTMKNV